MNIIEKSFESVFTLLIAICKWIWSRIDFKPFSKKVHYDETFFIMEQMISPKKVPKCAAGWLWLSHLLQQLHSFLTFLDRWDTQLKIKMGPFDWAQQMLLVYWVEVDTVCSATRVIKSRATMLIRVPLSLCLPSFEYQLKYQSENLHVHQNQSRRGRGE